MAGQNHGMLDHPFTSEDGSKGGMLPIAGGGGGGSGVDAVARALAASASANVNALTAQPGETIPVNGSVFGPWGQLTNNTAGPIVLNTTDPQTEATLLAAGLTPPVITATTPNELMAQAGKAVAPGETVYMPFGEYINNTAGTITLGVIDPPTNASLLADGLSAPTANGVDQLMAEPGEIIAPGETVYMPFGTYTNATAGNITVAALPDPPTNTSLLADGLTKPIIAAVNELTAQPGKVVVPGQTVYMPFGEYVNQTAGNITLGATDPATDESLLADGLTTLAANGVDQLMAEPGEVIAAGETVYMPYGTYTNATAGPITLGATDPATEVSLLADGLTVPIPRVDTLMAEAGETIAPGETVYMPFGEYKNETLAGITLAATDPPTEASLLADGLIKQVPTVAPTGTNFTVLPAAFADVEAPTAAEALIWYNATVGLGNPINVEKSTADRLFYTSAGAKNYAWALGDGDNGTLAIGTILEPAPESGGYELIQVPAVTPLTWATSPITLRQYNISATAPLALVNVGGTDYNSVTFALDASTATSQPIVISRSSTEHIHINALVNGDAAGIVINEPNRELRFTPAAGGGWTTSY